MARLTVPHVLRLERELARLLRPTGRGAIARGRRALDSPDPLATLAMLAQRPLLTATYRARVAQTVAQLVAAGAEDAAREIDRHRATFARRPPFGRIRNRVAQIYQTIAGRLVEQLEEAQHAVVRRVVEHGLRAGQVDQVIGADLTNAETGLTRRHADTWARTETTRFYTLGRAEVIEAADDVWGYEYVVIEDNRTTDICLGYVGRRVSKAGMHDYPPLHYNCRTTLMAVFFDEAPAGDDPPGPYDPDPGFGTDPREMMVDI